MAAQRGAGGAAPSAPAASAAPATPTDALGRDTPRGTLLGFMNAARDGRDDVASQYLNTRLRGATASELSHKLFVVLDNRLPPRLSELSSRPDGSLSNPLRPDQDIVGTITTANGPLDIVLERVTRPQNQRLWLFSSKTLDAVADAYDEVNLVSIDQYLPQVLTKTRFMGIRIFEWLVLLVIFPISYKLTGLLSRLVRWVAALWYRAWRRPPPTFDLVPGPVRLLMLAAITRWLVSAIELPFSERQFWWGITGVLAIIAATWALLMLNGYAERQVLRRSRQRGHAEVTALLRLVRRLVDVVIVTAGALVTAHFFGADPTAALAGLGIGGIAVALAAQKTLENVIGGVSIIFDKAVHVGDALKLGETVGQVDYIGLRSIRIRTPDRTVVSVPNSQVANSTIETLSVRDKYWFHHFVRLGYDTTAAQTWLVITGIRDHLASHPAIDQQDTVRVRLCGFGSFALDIEVFAYINARDWEGFLDTQQTLLLDIMDIVERAGASIALPSQTLRVTDAR